MKHELWFEQLNINNSSSQEFDCECVEHTSKKVTLFSSSLRKGSDMRCNFRTGKHNHFPRTYFCFNRKFPFSPDLEIVFFFWRSHCAVGKYRTNITTMSAAVGEHDRMLSCTASNQQVYSALSKHPLSEICRLHHLPRENFKLDFSNSLPPVHSPSHLSCISTSIPFQLSALLQIIFHHPINLFCIQATEYNWTLPQKS